MRVLVTGGAGFIGGNFVRYMLKNHPEDRVVCVDCLTYAGNIKSLESVMDNGNFGFCKIDITDRAAVFRVFEEERPEIVVNFAAESHVDRSIESPDLFLRTNVLGTGVLLDACLKYGAKRFHQISTDEVYGFLPLDKPEMLFSESSPLCPSSPYSASKASADLVAMSYYRTFGLSVTVTRCTNNYGAFQHPEKLIPLMITNALNDKPLPVYGNGENIRDWIYVEDHCRAVDLVMRYGKAGEIYNVGANNELSNINIVKMICRALGKSESLITFVADRKGHDLRYAVDAGKLRRELGWYPKTDFADGIAKTIEWQVEQLTMDN